MYIYVRNLWSAKTGVKLTTIHIDIKKELSKLSSLKLKLGAGILPERINGSGFSKIDCDDIMHYCDIRKRHTSTSYLCSGQYLKLLPLCTLPKTRCN